MVDDVVRETDRRTDRAKHYANSFNKNYLSKRIQPGQLAHVVFPRPPPKAALSINNLRAFSLVVSCIHYVRSKESARVTRQQSVIRFQKVRKACLSLVSRSKVVSVSPRHASRSNLPRGRPVFAVSSARGSIVWQSHRRVLPLHTCTEIRETLQPPPSLAGVTHALHMQRNGRDCVIIVVKTPPQLLTTDTLVRSTPTSVLRCRPQRCLLWPQPTLIVPSRLLGPSARHASPVSSRDVLLRRGRGGVAQVIVC